jgi:hypothetical protein
MSFRSGLRLGVLLAALALTRSPSARADEDEPAPAPDQGSGKGIETSGQVAADGRTFFQRPKYAGQEFGAAVSLLAEPEFKYKSKNEKHTFKLHPFYRLDPIDERRSHPDLREASYALTLEHFEASLGVGSFTWGALESYRPVDVINQIDFAESSDGSAKLGQPYAELGWVTESVSLKLYYLGYFRDRTFPGARGRLRFPAVIDVNSPQYESSLGRLQPSGAARLALNLGDFDLNVGLFTGLSREPRFIAELTTGEAAPRYDRMHQGSLDAQWTLGSFVFKGEGFVRAWSEALRVFGGGGVGVDYTLSSVSGDADLTFAGEFLFDTRPRDAAPTFFDHDAFLGARLAVNDRSNTEVFAGALVDVVDGTTFGRVVMSRRFGEHWKVALDGNLFLAPSAKLEGSLAKDNFAHMRLSYYF